MADHSAWFRYCSMDLGPWKNSARIVEVVRIKKIGLEWPYCTFTALDHRRTNSFADLWVKFKKVDINWWLRRMNQFFNLRIYSLIWDVTVIKNHSVNDQWSSSLFTLRKSKFHREYSIIWSFPTLARCTLIPHTGWIFEYD